MYFLTQCHALHALRCSPLAFVHENSSTVFPTFGLPVGVPYRHALWLRECAEQIGHFTSGKADKRGAVGQTRGRLAAVLETGI